MGKSKNNKKKNKSKNPVSNGAATGSEAAEETSTLGTADPLLETGADGMPDAEGTVSHVAVSNSEDKNIMDELQAPATEAPEEASALVTPNPLLEIGADAVSVQNVTVSIDPASTSKDKTMTEELPEESKEEEVKVMVHDEVEAEAEMDAEEFEDAEEELIQLVEPPVVSEVVEPTVEKENASKSPPALPKFLTLPPASSAAPDPPSTPPGSHPELPMEPARPMQDSASEPSKEDMVQGVQDMHDQGKDCDGRTEVSVVAGEAMPSTAHSQSGSPSDKAADPDLRAAAEAGRRARKQLELKMQGGGEDKSVSKLQSSEKPRVSVSQWAENRRKAAEAAEAAKQKQKEEELERRKDLLPKVESLNDGLSWMEKRRRQIEEAEKEEQERRAQQEAELAEARARAKAEAEELAKAEAERAAEQEARLKEEARLAEFKKKSQTFEPGRSHSGAAGEGTTPRDSGLDAMRRTAESAMLHAQDPPMTPEQEAAHAAAYAMAAMQRHKIQRQQLADGETPEMANPSQMSARNASQPAPVQKPYYATRATTPPASTAAQNGSSAVSPKDKAATPTGGRTFHEEEGEESDDDAATAGEEARSVARNTSYGGVQLRRTSMPKGPSTGQSSALEDAAAAAAMLNSMLHGLKATAPVYARKDPAPAAGNASNPNPSSAAGIGERGDDPRRRRALPQAAPTGHTPPNGAPVNNSHVKSPKTTTPPPQGRPDQSSAYVGGAADTLAHPRTPPPGATQHGFVAAHPAQEQRRTTTPNSTGPRSRQATLKSGYMFKKGGSKVDEYGKRSVLFGRRNWKRRFFTLDDQTGELKYYKAKHDTECLGQIDLKLNILAYKYTHHNRANVVAITCPGRENFLICTETPGDLEEWSEKISQHVQGGVQGVTSPLPQSY